MTRETKAGLVVSCSFLCLVGIVLLSKLRDPYGTLPSADALAEAGFPAAPPEPEPDKPKPDPTYTLPQAPQPKKPGTNEFGPPVLSKIPYIDRLFKNVGYGRDTSSLLIMVTPRIIINEEEEQQFLGNIPPIPREQGP